MNCLPAELIPKVILYLSKDDVSECLMVCQTWYAKISPVYYQKLQVSLSHQEFIEQIEEIRIDGKKLGDFARSIILTDPARIPLNENEFCRVLDNLPNLRTIHFDSGLNEYAYLMESIDVNKLKYVQEMTAKVHFKDIEDIYLSNNTVLKDKLTKLHITKHKNVARVSQPGEYKKVFDILASFKSLQHLQIVNQDITRLCKFESVLNLCTNLRSFRLESTYSSIFTNFTKHENLESLELNIEFCFTPYHLDYIMDNLPHLKNLKLSLIHIYENDPDILLFDLTSNRATRFLTYLQQVTSFTFEVVKDYDADAVTGWYDRFIVHDKRFWDYICVLVGEGYVCNLEMQQKDDNCFTNRTFVTVDREKKTIGIINDVWFDVDVFDEDWINALSIFTFHSVTIVKDDAGFDTKYAQFWGYERIINPVISKLKNTHHSSFIRMKATSYTSGSANCAYIILKFVSKDYFEYMQQNQPRREGPQGSSTDIRNDAENLLKRLKLTLGEHVVQGTASSDCIEYFVEHS